LLVAAQLLSVRKQVDWDGVTGPDQGRILL
jgi:hypothetical protein